MSRRRRRGGRGGASREMPIPPPPRATPRIGFVLSPLYERLMRWTLLVAFVALGVTLVLHHEPWRDEADPWLMARDASFSGLIRLAGYVGTPILWFLLQMPLAKTGLPYASVGFLNLGVAVAAIAVFLWRARLAWPLKALFVFSFFASYEYAAIARSYALSMLLLFALAALHPRRLTAPMAFGAVLYLLFNTNVHAIALAGPILARFGWEAVEHLRRPRPADSGETPAPSPITPLIGFGLALLGLALALLQLRQPADGQLTEMTEALRWRLIPTTLAGALFPGLESESAAWAAAGGVTLCVVAALWRRPRALAVMIGSFAGLWAIFVLKYSGSPRHWGFFLLAIVYALWTARTDTEAAAEATAPRVAASAPAWTIATIALGISLVWSVYVAQLHWVREIRDPFSASREMARFLQSTHLDELPIAAWPSPHAEAVLPYLPGKRFYDPGTRAEGTYLLWTRATVEGWSLSEDEVVRRIDQAFPPGRDVLFLANRPIAAAERAGFRVAHLATGNVIMGDEQYVLYRRGAETKE